MVVQTELARGHVCGAVLIAVNEEERATPNVGGSFIYFVSVKVGFFSDMRSRFFRLPE